MVQKRQAHGRTLEGESLELELYAAEQSRKIAEIFGFERGVIAADENSADLFKVFPCLWSAP